MTTPHYELALATDSDQMNDVNTWLNDNWDSIELIPLAGVVSVLPIMDFTYDLGDKVYHSVYQSMFVLVAQNANWGNFWRPVQMHYGPWIQPGNSIIANPGTYQFGTTPFQYRLSNTGRFICRGSVDTVSGSYADFEAGSIPTTLNPIPTSVAPAYRVIHMGTPYPQNMATVKPDVAQLTMTPDGHWTNVVWNSAGTATGLFFSNMEWSMGYTKGYGPDN